MPGLKKMKRCARLAARAGTLRKRGPGRPRKSESEAQAKAAAALGLPEGWRVRTYANPSGTKVHDYVSPSGRQFSSLPLVKIFLAHAKGKVAKVKVEGEAKGRGSVARSPKLLDANVPNKKSESGEAAVAFGLPEDWTVVTYTYPGRGATRRAKSPGGRHSYSLPQAKLEAKKRAKQETRKAKEGEGAKQAKQEASPLVEEALTPQKTARPAEAGRPSSEEAASRRPGVKEEALVEQSGERQSTTPRIKSEGQDAPVAEGEVSTPSRPREDEDEDEEDVYWRCTVPGCRAPNRVIYYGKYHCQQRYQHLKKPLHKNAEEAMKQSSEYRSESARSKGGEEQPQAAEDVSGAPLGPEEDPEVFWRCPIPGCTASNTVIYYGQRHCQMKYFHLNSKKHQNAEAEPDERPAVAERPAAAKAAKALSGAAKRKLKREGEREEAEADEQPAAAKRRCRLQRVRQEDAEDDAVRGASALALKPRPAPFLATSTVPTEQAALVAPMTIPELQAMGEEYRGLLQEQGFGSQPELVGVTGCSSPEASRWMASSVRGIFVRMPLPVGGRPCYQKVKQKSTGTAEVMFIEIYIFWCASSARWRIGDRPSQRAVRHYARSSLDWRRPPLGDVRGKWEIRTLDSSWEQDPSLMIVELGKEAAL